MAPAELDSYANWASIFSLLISLISFFLIQSVRANIIKFRRKQRLKRVMDDVLVIPDDATPLTSASKTKIASLQRNIRTSWLSRFTAKGRLAIEIHNHAKNGSIADLKEAINDWASYSEDV